MATTVSISYTSTTDLFQAQVDGKRVPFRKGKADLDVEAGTHYLQWYAEGEPGQTYTIEVTAPDSAAFKHTATLDAALKDAGHTWFVL